MKTSCFSRPWRIHPFTRHGFLPGRITMRYYEAGHMMYLHRPSLDQLLADVRAFIEGGKK